MAPRSRSRVPLLSDKCLKKWYLWRPRHFVTRPRPQVLEAGAILRSRGWPAATQRTLQKTLIGCAGSAKRGKSALIRGDSTCLRGWRELAYSAAGFDIDGQG